MTDVLATRRTNLNRIATEFPTTRAFARAIGHQNAGWLARALNGKRPVGTTAARGIEIKLGLAPGSLDESDTTVNLPISPLVVLRAINPTIYLALETFSAAIAADLLAKGARPSDKEPLAIGRFTPG